MHSFILSICAILASIISISQSFALPDTAAGAMEWTGPSKGVNVTLYGTAQEIVSQLKELDPHWTPASAPVEVLDAKHHHQSNHMQCCPIEYYKAVLWNDASKAAHDLISIGGRCTAGADACTIKSCENFAGVYFCNKKSKKITVPCATIGALTEDLVHGCTNYTTQGCGQISSHQGREDGWSVEVKYCVSV